MWEILTEKWLWIIIISCILIMVGPLLIVWVILNLPYPLNTIATICLIGGYGVAAGYREWVLSKRKERRE